MAEVEDWRRHLRDVAAADAPGVLEEARAAARRRARAMLEDALVDELLAAAAAPAPEHPHPAPEHPRGDAWWVYCVVPAPGAAELAAGVEGIEPDRPVETVEDGDLAVLASRVPLAGYGDEQLRHHLEDLAWLERTARGHEAVQEAVLRRAPLVPLRLCTIYRDREGVVRLLQENGEVFAQNLAAVDGCAEWGVKIFLDQRPGRGEPPSEQAASGKDYLAGRQRQRDLVAQVDELSARCAEEVHHVVAGLAREDRVNPVQSPEAHGREAEMVLNGAYLVEDSRIEALHSAVTQLHEEWAPLGLLVELTGPWPPYNFVSESAGMVT